MQLRLIEGSIHCHIIANCDSHADMSNWIQFWAHLNDAIKTAQTIRRKQHETENETETQRRN